MHRISSSLSSSSSVRKEGLFYPLTFVNLNLLLNLFNFPISIISFFILFNLLISAQPKTNLEIFYTLVDSSAKEFIYYIPESRDSVKIDLNLGESYSIFGNKIIAQIFSAGKVLSNENTNAVRINYVIDNAKVNYSDIYRDGLFGDYYIPRMLSLKGNFVVHGNSASFKEFNFSFIDSIRYDEINYIENDSYPFTKGDIPSEPFFSGLFEPIVAIGTAALAVILFFTIRSK